MATNAAGAAADAKTRKYVGRTAAAAATGDMPATDIEALVPAPATKAKMAPAPASMVPADILHDAELNEAIKRLPANYNLEVHKSVWRIRRENAKRVALQFPEGLMMYGCLLSDIFERFCDVETVILGDVTYGACCVDDYTARAMDCDLLIHYGHSCLVPVDVTGIKTMYVFVEIAIDVKHFVDTVRFNFPKGSKLALVSTVQFLNSLHLAKDELASDYSLYVPQSRPLSAGELLGCTSPRLGEHDALVYLADGRFHLEASMIANPHLPAYRYDPYPKVFSREHYETEEMHNMRKDAIAVGKEAKHFGIILGTLGRQGSPKVLQNLQDKLTAAGRTFVVVLLSEIVPAKIALFRDVDAWVQIACPRLSIDWGYAFAKPLLTPYELHVCLETIPWQEVYPMDFYAKDSLGPWTPNHAPPRAKAK